MASKQFQLVIIIMFVGWRNHCDKVANIRCMVQTERVVDRYLETRCGLCLTSKVYSKHFLFTWLLVSDTDAPSHQHTSHCPTTYTYKTKGKTTVTMDALETHSRKHKVFLAPLTEEELNAVTIVFHQYETGLREGCIFTKVSLISQLIMFQRC